MSYQGLLKNIFMTLRFALVPVKRHPKVLVPSSKAPSTCVVTNETLQNVSVKKRL